MKVRLFRYVELLMNGTVSDFVSDFRTGGDEERPQTRAETGCTLATHADLLRDYKMLKGCVLKHPAAFLRKSDPVEPWFIAPLSGGHCGNEGCFNVTAVMFVFYDECREEVPEIKVPITRIPGVRVQAFPECGVGFADVVRDTVLAEDIDTGIVKNLPNFLALRVLLREYCLLV
jgi:hypothetical protein